MLTARANTIFSEPSGIYPKFVSWMRQFAQLNTPKLTKSGLLHFLKRASMAHNFSQWYEDNYHLLTANGLWLRGGEFNTQPASLIENASLKVLISRLSTSWDVADSYTHKILYELIADIDNVFTDLSYLPPQDDGALMTQSGVPWLIGTASKMSGASFDVIAFSNSIVQEMINIPILLHKSGIPVNRKERYGRNDVPLIILGGANALFTSALLGENSFVDGIFTGESSSLIKQLFTIIRDGKKRGDCRELILTALESVPGFFQPHSQSVTAKCSPVHLETENLPSHPPLSSIGDQAGRAQIPISEGCPCFCSFCAESWSRKPYREFLAADIKQSAIQMKTSLGAETVELYSFNFSMHSSFYTILQDMVSLFPMVKVSSQRFDHIADDPQLLQYLHAIGKSTFTCGLEGISARLRRYLHKSLDERKLQASLTTLMRSPVRELKIFLIATGKETEEDYNEFRDFLTNLLQMMQASGRRPRIVFSMTPLVRFPFTPLESEDAPEPSVYHEIIHQTERLVKCRGMEFRTASDINDYLLSQILVRAFNPEIIAAFHEIAQKTGYVYYREIPDVYIKEVIRLLDEKQLPLTSLLGGRTANDNRRVPVTTEVQESFLETAKENANKFIDNGYCLGSFTDASECKGCGACKDGETITLMTSERERRAPSPDSFKKLVKGFIEKSSNHLFHITIDQKHRGVPRNVIGSILASALMKAEPQLVSVYRKYCSSHVETLFGSTWISGDDILTCEFLSGAESLITQPGFLEKINEFTRGWFVVNSVEPQNIEYDYTLSIQSSYKADPSSYCADYQLKHTLRKNSNGTSRYEFTPQSLKKQHILFLDVDNTQTESQVTLKAGAKFNIEQFLERSFALPSVQHKVRIQCSLVISVKK